MEKRLLVVDDNKDIIEIASEVLAPFFEKIDSAHSVDEAIHLLNAHIYDFILLDINLDGRNGAEIIKYLVEHESNPNKSAPFVIMSGIITKQFIDKHQSKFAGILIKPFDHEELIKLVEEVVQGKRSLQKNWEQTSPDEIPYLKCALPFPIYQLEERVNKILDQVRKNLKLKQFFSKIVVDRGNDNYMMAHVGMMINISTAISSLMDWNTDKTLEKFVYASYLHDMALGNRSDLARIHTLEELEENKKTLTAQEFKVILEHPNIAANSIEEMAEIPADVALIVRQHHELPKENGFPAKCGHQKIPPLSAIFIVANDMATYIYNNPDWAMEDYIKKAKSKFKGIQFTKIIVALENSK